MDRKWHRSFDVKSCQKFSERRRRHRRAAHRHKNVTARIIIAFQCSQCAQLFPTDLVHAGHTVLHAPHVQEPVLKIDLVPRE